MVLVAELTVRWVRDLWDPGRPPATGSARRFTLLTRRQGDNKWRHSLVKPDANRAAGNQRTELVQC